MARRRERVRIMYVGTRPLAVASRALQVDTHAMTIVKCIIRALVIVGESVRFMDSHRAAVSRRRRAPRRYNHFASSGVNTPS
jgi:hypothetical protein